LPSDTGQNTPDVTFKYNVGPYSNAFDIQGKLGRGTISIRGYWVVYIQGAYEGEAIDIPIPAGDNDPDNENALLGNSAGTLGEPAHITLILFETIRDDSNEHPIYDNEYLNLYVALHEIGHHFELADGNGCVMNYAPWVTPTFCSNHIRDIRSLLVPSAPILNVIDKNNRN